MEGVLKQVKIAKKCVIQPGYIYDVYTRTYATILYAVHTAIQYLRHFDEALGAKALEKKRRNRLLWSLVESGIPISAVRPSRSSGKGRKQNCILIQGSRGFP